MHPCPPLPPRPPGPSLEAAGGFPGRPSNCAGAPLCESKALCQLCLTSPFVLRRLWRRSIPGRITAAPSTLRTRGGGRSGPPAPQLCLGGGSACPHPLHPPGGPGRDPGSQVSEPSKTVLWSGIGPHRPGKRPFCPQNIALSPSLGPPPLSYEGLRPREERPAVQCNSGALRSLCPRPPPPPPLL